MPGVVVTAMMAVVFLTLLWIGRIHEMLIDLFFGYIDFSDDCQWDLTSGARQIDKATHLFRSGKCRRALRLCNCIITSNSYYTSTAMTLVYWIENPGTLRFFSPPRITIKLKEKHSI